MDVLMGSLKNLKGESEIKENILLSAHKTAGKDMSFISIKSHNRGSCASGNK